MDREKLLEMTGSVEQVIFRNEKNGYAVIELNNGEELVTVVGTMPFIGVGEELHVVGSWVNSQTYGTQFRAQALERSQPADAAALLKYLSSGAVKGVGPAIARKIVDTFGENAIQVLENEPERLSEIRGITRAKARKIGGEFQRVGGIREMMVKLSGFGITPEEAVRVWKAFGPQAEEQVKQDPYCLCGEGVGVDFARADRIAASLERPQDDRCRLRAGIVYVLKHNEGNGHTCLPADKLAAAAAHMLGVDGALAAGALEEMKADSTLVARVFRGREFLFTPRLYRAEVYTAGRIRMMLRYPAQSIVGIDGYIATIEAEQQISYAELQKTAIREALTKGMLILTGGPGTGKTTTLNAIIRILEFEGEKVLLTAPTGRAAKRMSELTGKEAKTIHRLLRVRWDEDDRPEFEKNEKDLLECDTLIIDELSMVDTLLFEAVLRALPLGCRLILVGDCDQLPSVGPGNVLGDLIASGLLPVVQLREVFRQSMKSLIVANAHKIVAGRNPDLTVHTSDFFFLPYRTAEEIGSVVVDLYGRRLPASYGYSPLTDIQVLSPARKGELGAAELNRKLQQAVNPPAGDKNEIVLNGVLFREGDKVMQVRNDYDLPWTRDDGTYGEGVFNGDLGILLQIDRRASTLAVKMDDRTVVYETETASELELAYAMTVHKSQGSEFPAVIIPMYRGAPRLYYRNLLYTAVTRAKSLLILVGRPETVRQMVANGKKTRRYTGLYDLLTGDEENEAE
ncbi:MAG: ATP-dependent RecD-like DNA helicase [Oscillospiraceae bacterium]|jgi:exodeoxyribonuclease V alpha subunit|nr:ATP-dependent RecD-like DNA helicase [Oscillospiraceae bacterium]MCI1990631.1 ATP-dependent RecD-like DNA helicase [Oscillospiraceae bacterium]MCI2036344.1 ATP-dependent RecD-like DNA helicase [Oscillospiraceae bacterium]